MSFNIGDYVKHKEFPKCNVILHLTDFKWKEVINAHAEKYEYATEQEIEQYHKDYDDAQMDD